MSLQAVELILPLFLIIAVGYGFRKSGFIGESFAIDLNRVVFYFALPSTLFLETSDLPGLSREIALLAVLVPLIVVFTAFFSLLVTLRMARRRRGPFIQASYRSNMAYIGLPIVSTLMGPESLAAIAVVLASGVITNSVVSILVLRLFQADGGSDWIRGRLLDIVRNPLIIAIVLGLIVSLIGVPVPGILGETLALFSRISLPLILLVVGFRLSFRNIGGYLSAAFGASFVKLVLMPLFVWAAATWLFPVEPFARTTLVLLFTMPTAIASQSFAEVFEADGKLAAAAVSVSTLLSAITIPLWALLLM